MGTHELPTIASANPRGLIAPVRALQFDVRAARNLPGRSAFWRQSRSERFSAAAMVVLLHAATIALVMLSRSTASMADKPGLVAFDITSGSEPKPQPASPHHPRSDNVVPVPPAPLTPPPPLINVADADLAPSVPEAALFAVSAPREMPASLAGSCDLTQPVQDALRHSEQIGRQLPTIPANDRSVANAIVLWNAGWITTTSAPTQVALATIRQTITQAIAAASPECRNQLQAGPRLLYLPVNMGETLVLALGSGRWTWQQLVDGNQPLPANIEPPAAVPLFAKSAAAPAAAVVPGQPTDPGELLASLVRQRSPAGLPYNP
jgi:hypothetical protein